MTQRIPQSTSFLCVFKAYLASDHVTEATGKTIVITISKNGGAFGNPNAGATNATEISSGWYKVTLDTTDTGTEGPLAVRGAVATVDDVGVLLQVVKATNGGLTALPDALPGATNGLFIAGTNAATTVTTSLTTTFTGNLTGSVASVTGAVGSVTGNVGGNVTGSVGSVTGAVGSVTGAVGSVGAGGIAAATFAAGAIDAAAISADAGAEIADAILDRNMATGTDSGSPTVRTMRQALRFLRNKWSISGTTLTVTAEDDATTSWTSTLAGTAGADPITSSDPA